MAILTTAPADDNGNRNRSTARFATSTEIARLCGVSFMTVNRACDSGDIEHTKSGGGHRRVDIKSACEYFGCPVPDSYVAQGDELQAGKIIAVYGRVSTAKQGDNLKRQVARLEAWVAENYAGQEYKVFSEIGSGINNERPQLLKLLDYILAGRVSVLVVEFGDRLSRSARSLIVSICGKCGTEVIETRTGEQENNAATAQDEMFCDITAIMTVYAAKQHGKRAGDKTRFVASPELKARMTALHAEGKSTREIGRVVIAEGYKCLNTGKVVAIWSVNNLMKEIKGELAKANSGPAPQSVAKFIKLYCATGKGKQVYGPVFFRTYAAFCKREGLEVLNRQILASTLRGLGYQSDRVNNANLIKGLSLKHNARAGINRKAKVVLPPVKGAK
jgi:putative resolvase